LKKALLRTVGLAALAAVPAFGADLRPPVYKGPLPAAPVWSWTGCYIGGHIGGGYAWTESTNTFNTTAFGDFFPGQGYANHSSGVVGGGHLGCNYQVARMVIGIEGTYSAADIKRDYASPFGGGDDVYTNRITAIATVVGRLGWAFDNWLFYSKAGWAGARATLSVVDNIAPIGAGSDSHWHNGFTVGSGLEYAFTPNWIAGFETNYYRFESKSYEIGGNAGFYTFDSRPRDVYTFLGRLSFKFGGPIGPVMAAY
jgi:outer membrane immunogenic protein